MTCSHEPLLLTIHANKAAVLTGVSVFMMQVLNICSSDDFDGLDYMAATFHSWLQEPGRLIFIARMNNRVVRSEDVSMKIHLECTCAVCVVYFCIKLLKVALESVLLVDGGQTAMLQGLRVVSDLRGQGISGALQRHVIDYIHRHYPQVCAGRFSRGIPLSPQTPSKYRLIVKEVSHASVTEM